jgi:hypothetical protein
MEDARARIGEDGQGHEGRACQSSHPEPARQADRGEKGSDGRDQCPFLSPNIYNRTSRTTRRRMLREGPKVERRRHVASQIGNH